MAAEWVSAIGSVFQAATAIGLAYVAYRQMIITEQQKEIAAQQTSILHAQNQLALYERRFKVYDGLMRFIGSGQRKGDFTNEDFREFWQSTGEAKFLFDKNINLFIKEVGEKAASMSANALIMKNATEPSLTQLIHQHESDMQLLRNYTMEAPGRFERYLDFREVARDSVNQIAEKMTFNHE